MELKLSPKELLALHDLLRTRGQQPDEEQLSSVYGRIRAYLVGSLNRSDSTTVQKWLDKEQAKIDALHDSMKEEARVDDVPVLASVDDLFSTVDSHDETDTYPRKGVPRGPGPGKFRGNKR